MTATTPPAADRTAPAGAPTPPLRSFLVATRGTAIGRVEGDAFDLDAIIEAHGFPAEPPPGRPELAWDRVVFDGPAVVAVIRRAPDGSARVHRFDD